VPFTSAALDNYHGELSGTNTGQLFFVNYEANPADTTDTRQIDFLNSNDALGSPTFVAAAQTGVTGSPGSSSYLVEPRSIGVDTPNGLFFALDDTGILYSGHISNSNSPISSQTIASQSNGDGFGAMTVDPVDHLVYVGIFGGAVNANDTSENEIYAVSYNPQNGVLGTPQYNASNFTNTTTANTLISTASDPSFNTAVGLTLDQTTSKLYVIEEAFGTYNDTYSGGSFLFPEKNEIDVISSTARNQTTQETLVSLPLQNLANGDVNPAYIGYIGGVAVDDATDKLYFTLNTSTNTGGIYYVSLDGGANQTPTKLDLTGLNSNLTANGLKLDSSFSGYDDITIDPATGQLYVTSEVQTVSNPDSSVSITDPGEIYQFTLNGAGTGFTGASIFYQYGTATSAELPFGNQSNLDFVSLPVLTTTGTTAAAVHNGAAITLLAGAPTITDISGGGYIDGATVQILGGATVESGDVLSINGTTFTSTPTTFIDNGSIFDVSYSTTTNTLTITSLPNATLHTDAQYAHLLAEVQYTDGATSTATRTVTWQVNNGAPGTPSGTNEKTTTVNVSDGPTPGALTFVTDSGTTDLKAGHVVTFTLATSETVFVTGTPELQLSDGKFATYTGGSGSQALTFSYTVAAGDTSSDLQVAGANPNGGLALNGGSILDGTGNALTGSVATDTHFIIDTTAPGAPTLALAADTGISNTDHITSNPTITVTPAESGGTLLYKIDGATSYSTTAPNFATDGTADGAHTVSVEQEDAAGNIGAATSISFTLETITPATQTLALATDTGLSNTDHITSNPTITYSAPTAGDILLYKVDTGSFSTTVPVFATDGTADGAHTVSVEQEDVAGNVSAATSLSFTLDTTAPGAPTLALADDTGVSNTDHITKDPTITVTSAESGGILLYKIDGATSYSTTAPSFATDGTADGVHTVSVEQEDAAGNIGAATSISFTLETVTPATATLALATDTGLSNTDHITSNPSINYSAPVAGDILLYKADTGSFSTTVPVFATDGSADGAHTVSVEQEDAAGNVSAATSLSFTLDTTAPGAPTLALAVDTGVSNTDHITNDPTITVTSAESGGILLYKIDGATSYSTTAPSFATDGTADGAHTVSVEQEDAAGNIGAATSISFTLETVTPGAPTLSLAHDSGVSSTDHITNDPTITYSAPVAGDILLYKVDTGSFSTTVPVFATDGTADGAHTVSIEQEDGAGNLSAATSLSFVLDTTAPGAPTLALAADTGVSNTDHITNDPAITVTSAESGGILLYKIDGATSYSTTAPSFATDGTADGPHTVSVEQEDAAGNIGAATSISFTLETVTPATPTLVLANDTGISGTDHITSDPTITYSVAAGDILLYKVDGSSFSTTMPVFATNGTADGAHTVSVEQEDAAGNISAATSLSFTLDSISPTAGTLSFVTDNGASDLNAGHTVTFTLATSEDVFVTGTPELQLTDGEFATYTGGSGSQALTFEYTVAAGDTSADLQVAGVNPNGGLALNGGSIVDDAGNALAGTVATDTHLVIDTTAPTETPPLTATTDNGQSDIGIGHTVTITLDTSEVVNVTGTPTILLNNGEAANYEGGTGTDVLTFTYKVAAGDTTSDLQVTGYSGTIHDAAGNSLGPVSGDLALQIDGNVPPTPTLALAHDTGISSNDHITSNPTITYSAAAAGDTLLYKVDGGSFSPTAPNFEADPNFATDHSADGTHTVSVEQQDALGNVSAVASLTFTLDTTPPILTGIAASPNSGSIFAGSTETFTFAFDEAVDVTGGTPSLTLNDGGTAVYDAAATAALHDPTKMAFDYLVSSNDPPTPSLAVTGYNANGANVADLAGNLANLSNVAATFNTMVNENTVPAFNVGGLIRPALELDSTGHIILDAAASAAAAAYGIKFLYLGLPESTPYPPVADTHLTDFHLIV
jgi:hypothetical protein